MRNKITRIVRYAALITMVLAISGCGVSKLDHVALEKKYDRVQQEITGFNEQVKKMQEENISLRAENKALKEQLKGLTATNSTLKADNDKLTKESKKQEA